LTTLGGRPNRILQVGEDSVIVATERSPGGQPVPILWVQQALDRLVRDGRSYSAAARGTLSGVTSPGSARSGSCLASRGTNHGLVFPNTMGKPLQPSQRSATEVLSAARASGLPRIRFHDLRHSAATLLLGLGITPRS
jgi:integrase